MVVGSDLAELAHLSEWGGGRTPALAPAPRAGGDLLMAFGGQVSARLARAEHARGRSCCPLRLSSRTGHKGRWELGMKPGATCHTAATSSSPDPALEEAPGRQVC